MGLGEVVVELNGLLGCGLRFRHRLLRRKSADKDVGACQPRVSQCVARVLVNGLLEVFTSL